MNTQPAAGRRTASLVAVLGLPRDAPDARVDARLLVARLPLPAVILCKDGTLDFINAQAREQVGMTWLAAQPARLWSAAAQGHASVTTVTDPAGRSRPMSLYFVSLGERLVVVFDDEAGHAAAAEVASMRQRIEELERTSATDRLTGLWNRRHFDQVIEREMSFSESQLSPLSLMIFDIDHFKDVNDRCGHAVGDEVLSVVAARLRVACRPTDFLFRWGGEEFALLAPAASASAAKAIAERVRACVAAQTIARAGRITLSAGVGEHREGESAGHWFERVDAALYDSKKTGRNCVTVSVGGSSGAWRARMQGSALQLVWSEACVSGDSTIDGQHRALFDATNVLMASLTDQAMGSAAVLEQVDCLLSAVARHFTDEEQILAQVKYPELEAHRRLHAKLLQSARVLRGNVHSGQGTVGEVIEFIAFEVVNRHILKADRHFFPFVAGRAGEAGLIR